MIKALQNFFKLCVLITICIIAGAFLYISSILIWPTPKMESLAKHDAIIVLTGEKNRIESAFKILLNKNADSLLISGVLDNISRQEIIDSNSASLSQKEKQKLKNHCCIYLDYVSDTTETNAQESTKWIKKKNIKSIILVTTAPHMPRAYLQFSRALSDNISITPYPVRNKNRLSLVIEQRFWSYAAHEYIKFLGSWIRLERQA